MSSPCYLTCGQTVVEVMKIMLTSFKMSHACTYVFSDPNPAAGHRRPMTSAPLVLDRYLDKESVELFSKLNVYTAKELEARTEIKWEQYVKKIQIEARVLGELAMNHIVPIASRYEDVLLDKVWKMKQIGMESKSDTNLIRNIQKRTSLIQTLVNDMIEARKVANVIENTRQKAIAYHDTVAIYFDKIRTEIDKLEEVVDDQIWTLPKYREILFVK